MDGKSNGGEEVLDKSVMDIVSIGQLIKRLLGL